MPPSEGVDLLAREIRREGHDAWPTVDLPAARVVEHFARLEASVTDFSTPTHGADLYLALACVDGIDAALEVCDRVHVAEALASVRHLFGSTAPADDVRQTVRAKLFLASEPSLPRIAAYAGRGPLVAWLRVVVSRVALDMHRQRVPLPATDDDALFDLAAPAGDPELEHLRTQYQGEFKRAFHEALAGLDAEERSLLRLHLVDALSIDEIAPLFRIHRATAARRLERARTSIADRTRDLLADRLKVTPSELASLMGLLISQLDVSIVRILGRTP